MSIEHTSGNKDRKGSRTWESEFGRYRFRTRWDRGPGHMGVHFQGPFIEYDDPDGTGNPFSSDFGFKWENEHGVCIYNEHGEHRINIRGRAKQASHWAAKRAWRYALRTIRNMPSKYWSILEREVSSMTEEEKAELQDVITHILHEWNRLQTESQMSRREQRPQAQRVPIEYGETNDIFADDSSVTSTEMADSASLTQSECDVQHHTILEELRTGAISLQEAEHRLNKLS